MSRPSQLELKGQTVRFKRRLDGFFNSLLHGGHATIDSCSELRQGNRLASVASLVLLQEPHISVTQTKSCWVPSCVNDEIPKVPDAWNDLTSRPWGLHAPL